MFIYTVQPGDTLTLLSRRFDVPVVEIAADNGLKSPYHLTVGQNLVIMSDIMLYRVEEGQTLFSIAREFEVPLNTLIEANPDVNPIALRIGDEIVIPQQRELSLRPAVINGYAYPAITDSALNCALPSLTFLSPFSYSISPSGEIFAPNDDVMIEKARNAGVMPLMTVANIYEGTFSTEVMSEILADEQARENMITNMLNELSAKNYFGLNLDIEYISPDDREAYNVFLLEVSERVHDAGYILVTAVAPKYRADQPGILYESHDYAVQGQAADYVVIMTYEWGYTFGYA